MTGSDITVTEISPNCGKKLIFFSATMPMSGQLDFSRYASVDWVQVWDSEISGVSTRYISGISNGDYIQVSGSVIAGYPLAVKGLALVTE